MKKYSADFFEKKCKTLFQKLLVKEGFLDDIKKSRKKLGLPENGYRNELELAEFFVNNMSEDEQITFAFFAFIEEYEEEHKKRIGEENRNEVIEAYQKVVDEKGIPIGKLIFMLGGVIYNHHRLFSEHHFFKKNRFLSKMYPETIRLIKKYWALDMLDEHITANLVERYLFMGEAGVNQYIKNKTACPVCRYIGVDHFSPDRHDMEGQDKGPYSGGYIFNKEAVRRLSLNFHSVFIIVKPYATKEAVLQYVRDNWDLLKEHMTDKNTFYKQYDVHPSKIKESNIDKNQLIYELYKKPKKELLGDYHGEKDLSLHGVYKETVVAEILREKYAIDMLPDAVKKASARFAKSIKLKKQPKDIGDI